MNQSPAPAVSISGLRVVRGSNIVIPGLDLALPGGIITGLLGPSGCGKSTLMRAIVGVQRITAGEVTVLGDHAGSPPLRTRVGYVTQAPSVYRDLSVAENLEFFRRVLGASRESVARAMAAVSLDAYKGRTAGDLSGGQFARVSLAAALIGDAELLVLDEPTVGLDPILRQELWRLFHQLSDSGTTLIVSSHVMDEASHCDELVLMRDGRVIAHEPPGRLLARTGAKDIDDAFVSLVESDMAVAK
jgi:ABC-2 type transport system ATP-binding protein